MESVWKDEEGKDPSVFQNEGGGKKNPVATLLKEE